jgi:hypothetical protein
MNWTTLTAAVFFCLLITSPVIKWQKAVLTKWRKKWSNHLKIGQFGQK